MSVSIDNGDNMSYQKYRDTFEDELNEAWGCLSDKERQKYWGAEPFEMFCYAMWSERE